MTGPSGNSSNDRCQMSGTSAAASACCCNSCSTGLTSIKWTTIAARKPATTCAARNASSIMVPRPGPSSTRRTFSGWPIRCHVDADQRPMSSPNTWLISGEVTKSPLRPSGSRVM
jgi:hypothetical protein